MRQSRERMTIGDLIQNKDYDYISWRIALPKEFGNESVFCGVSCSINGELISLDGDSYSIDTEIIEYEEWDNPDKGIHHGLTVICSDFGIRKEL